MNRYQWLIWAFRLFFSGEVIAEVKAMIVSLESQPISGLNKRLLIEGQVLPAVKNAGAFLLRALIEVLLSEVRGAK